MGDQPSGEVPSETAQAWDSVHRVREPVAWTLLALAAIIVIVSAAQLFNLAGATIPVASSNSTSVASSSPVPVPVGSSPVPVPVGSSPVPVPVGPSPVPVSAFALRASSAAPQFYASIVIALPVLAVVLVAFSGGLTKNARQVVQAAALVQVLAFALGVISLAGAAGSHVRPGTWFILEAAELATAATALIFTGAVLRSRALRSLAPRFPDLADDEDYADDPDFGHRD